VITDVRCAWHDTAPYLIDCVIANTRRRRRSRRRARRARWGWPSSIAVGANEPVANQTSRFDCDSSTQIIDIRGLSDPGTIGKGWCRFIERGRELTGGVSYEEPDKEIRCRYHRGRNDSGYKCVRALLRDYSGSHRQYHRVSG